MKKLIALLLAVVMVLGLAACATKTETPATDTPATDTPAASTETETKTETKEETPAEETDAEFNPADYTLVISMPVVNHPVHRCVQLGFVEACKELGYNYQIVGTETGDDNEVIAAAEAAAASGAAGIIIWGQNETYLPCIATLKNDYNVLTCVPHFAWDQDQAVGLDVNLACDAATYAVSVADYMAEQLEGKTGSIALTQAGYTLLLLLSRLRSKSCRAKASSLASPFSIRSSKALPTSPSPRTSMLPSSRRTQTSSRLFPGPATAPSHGPTLPVRLARPLAIC